MVRPATTARMVAKATAEMIPSSSVPPSSKASSGAAEFTPPGAVGDRVGTHERGGTEAQHEAEQVEHADQADRPDHRLARLLGGRHRVEAHQHVRQAGGAEHQGQRQRDEVDLASACSCRTWRPARAACRPSGLLSAAAPITFDRLNPYLLSTQKVISAAPRDQQDGLDDLHPGGALHATDEHVDDHQDAHDGDRDRLADPAGDAHEQARPARRRRPSGPAGRRRTPRGWTVPPPCAPGAGASGRPARRPW